MGKLSLIFKALSDPLRLRIVRLLLRNGKEAYGEELARALDIPAYRLSRHLKVLKTTGLINARRVGRLVYYSLAKRNGQLLTVLRRLIAEGKTPQGFGEEKRLPISLPIPRGSRKALSQRRSRKVQGEAFNWDQGPAIPGIL